MTAAPTATGTRRRIDAQGVIRAAVRWREPLIVVALTALAAFLRLYRLGELPFGIHGDEALIALEAHRVLDQGWIGPYVTISAGFPSGPLYMIAPALKLFGDSVFSVRLAIALLGTASIPAAYVAFRQAVSWRISAVAAFLIAVSDWHIHLSRLSFLVGAWPFIEMVALGLLLAALRTGRWYLYAAAGAATAFNWYTYDAALLYPIGIAAYLAFRFVFERGMSRRRELVLYAVLGVSALAAAWPMLDYARDPVNDFSSHRRAVSITKRPEYEGVNTPREKLEFFSGRTRDFYKAIAWSPLPDAADGLGVKPPIDAITVALAVLGGAIALWRWRQPAYAIALLMVALMAVGPVTTYVGTYRRSFGMVPFIALLAGTTLGLLWERADSLPAFRRVPALALIGVLLGMMAFSNLNLYFNTFEESRHQRVVFFAEMTTLSEHLATLPDGTYLYFYSLRAQRGSEIRRFLAPKLDEGIDRSHEFGVFSMAPDRDPPFVYTFMDRYLETLPRVMARYTGGTVTERRDRFGLLYRTYEFPAGSRVEGSGLVRFTGDVAPPPDAERAGLPLTASCVRGDRQPLSFMHYHYVPDEDVYAVLRGRSHPLDAGTAMVIWRDDAGVLSEISCAATGSFANENLEDDLPELGLTATTGQRYIVGFVTDPDRTALPLRLWEQPR
ncbi:MAG: hypothetical protein WEC75_09830 [Dehalococcoidia bacterium]